MLRFLVCLFLISEAQKNSDDALLKGVKQTLNVCSDIVEAVGDFLSIFETDRRRDSLGVAVTKKLKVCRQLVELVDDFRQKHSSLKKPSKKKSPKKVGGIVLKRAESEFLDEQLKSVSMKLGETLYVASKDGDSAAVFHKKCDDQGPTVVIVETKAGNVFGGYTTASWKARYKTMKYKKSAKAFVYSLRPIRKKYPVRKGQEKYAIAVSTRDGPAFGQNGFDLRMVSGALKKKILYQVDYIVWSFSSQRRQNSVYSQRLRCHKSDKVVSD